MSETSTTGTEATQRRHDFWTFWAGQTVSNLGNAITLLAVPLLIFRLTGSALNLALATTATYLPYLLFGLIIGAWVDRLDRRRLMIAVDLAQALLLSTIPLLAWGGMLSVWWVYGVGFLSSTLGIAFQSAQFAAIPSLVGREDLVAANGRIQASFSLTAVGGPLLAGLLFGLMRPEMILLLDAATFVVSAGSLVLIRTSFNATSVPAAQRAGIRRDISEGLRYVLGHPVLRAISLMMALVNFVAATSNAQLVLFAKERFAASDSQVGLLYAAGGAGMVLLSLLAGLLRRRWSFGTVVLGALMANGLLIAAFAFSTDFWLALPLWALAGGAAILFNINSGSLRQAIVPNHLLGRVVSIAGVLAWSGIPLGSFLGGLAIKWTGNVALVYEMIGLAIFLIALAFTFSTLTRAERYLPADTQPARHDRDSAVIPA